MRMIPSDVYQEGIDAVLKYLRSYIPGFQKTVVRVIYEEEAGIGSSKLAKEMKTYLNKKEFSDICIDVAGSCPSLLLKAIGRSFYSHKCILLARCPAMLVKKW